MKKEDFKKLKGVCRSTLSGIVVVGGGPAGISTALALHQLGYQVLVIDSRQLKGYCPGEHVGPEVKQIFNDLFIPEKIWLSNSINCFEIKSCWGSEEIFSNESIYNPYGEGLLLSRPQFDFDLIQFAIEQGIKVILNTHVIKIARSSSGWKLTLNNEGILSSIESFFLIDAGGRNSKFYKGLGAIRKKIDNLVGITSFLKSKKDELNQGFVLLEATKFGWWYSAGLAQGKIVATFFTEVNELQKLGRTPKEIWCKALTPYTKGRLATFKICAGPYSRTAHSHVLDKFAGEDWLAVGDSAMSFDPLSSQGIYKGLSMGQNAAGYIDGFFKGEKDALMKYSAYYENEFRSYLKQRFSYYSQEKRWPNEGFWKKRVLQKY